MAVNRVEFPKSELYAVIQEFNPWWTGQPLADLPDWGLGFWGRGRPSPLDD